MESLAALVQKHDRVLTDITGAETRALPKSKMTLGGEGFEPPTLSV